MELCTVKALPVRLPPPQVFPSEDALALIAPDCHQRDLCDLILFSYSDSLAAVMNISDVHFFIFDLSRRSSSPADFEMLNLIILTHSVRLPKLQKNIFFVGFLVLPTTINAKGYNLFIYFFVFLAAFSLAGPHFPLHPSDKGSTPLVVSTALAASCMNQLGQQGLNPETSPT